MLGLQGWRAVEAGASSSTEILGRLERTTTVPTPHGRIGKYSSLTVDRDSKPAAYECLPLADAAVSNVAMIASHIAVHCLRGVASFGGSSHRCGLLYSSLNFREHDLDNANVVELFI
jgi:hypothetical protein